MSNISGKPGLANQAKTKAQLLAELNELRQRVAHLEAAAEPLNQSEERYRSVVTAMAEGVVMVQRSGEIVACNPAAEQILGLTPKQMMGQAPMDPDWRTIYEDGTSFPGELHPIQVTLQTGQPQRNVVLGLHKPAGALLWLSINAEPLFQPGNPEPYAVVATFSDITEQRQTQEQLRQSEAKYRAIFDNDIYAVCLFDRETRQLLDVNEAFTRLYGYSRAELLAGMTNYDLTAEAEATDADIQEENLPGPLFVPLRYHRKKDGTIFPVEIGGGVCQWQGHTVIFALVHDISARKQAEKALLESQERLALTIKGADLATWDWHVPSGGVVFNERWAEMLGYTLAEIEPHVQSWEKLLHPDDAPAVLTVLNAHLEGQTSLYQTEYRLRSKSEEWKWILDTGRVLERDEQGRSVRVVGVHQDITDRKQAEATLRASEGRFATIFQASPLSISIIRLKDHQLIDINPAWLSKTGFSREEVIDRTPLELNLWVNLDERGHMLRLLREDRTVQGLDVQIRLKSGAVVDVLMSAELIEIAGERCMLVITQDITERKQAEMALRASEARFATVFRVNPLSISIIRVKDSQIIDVNEMWLTKTGFSREEVIGRTPLDLNLWPNPADRERLIRQLREDGTVQGFETQIRVKSGGVDDVLMSAGLVEVAGEPCLLTLAQGITERKRMEMALRESQERLELVVAAAELGTWDSHLPSGVAVFNERWTEMLGYTLAEIEPALSAWEKLADPDDLVRVQEGFQAHLEGQIPHFQIEHRLRTKSGEWKWILTIGKVMVRDEQGQPIRVVGIHQDITERKQVEENLRRYQQMVSLSPDWLALIDRNYVYQIVNEAFLALGTKTQGQVIGHSVAEQVSETRLSRVIKFYLDQALAGETVHHQDWFDFPALGRRFINVTCSPYYEKEGTISGVMISGRDVTEAKLLEERLHQVKKMETVGQLAAGMAHHYNSMLTTIIGFTSLSLHRLPPSDPMIRNLKQILQTAERMAVLVRQLLAFSRKQLLQPKTVNLNELVLQLQPELEQHLPASVEFIPRLAPEVSQVKIDLSQFEHLLRALVSNAVDAMPEGGRLTLTTANVSLGPVEAGWYELTPGNYVLLTVQDTGIGLTDEVKAHLFEPFFTTKEVGQGMGLELSMSLGIAKQHGGHLLAESEPGQGATFMLYLPRLAPPSPVGSNSPKTILLVEAEPIVREFVAEILSDQGYTILKATTNEVALPLMTDRPEVSLQLLLTSARSNSQILIEHLKVNSPGLKVIFLIDELDELPQERVDFLLKPFTPSSLVEKVRVVLDAASE